MSIEPHSCDLSIIGQQLSKLVLHELQIVRIVAMTCTSCTMSSTTCLPGIIITRPIQQRIIHKKFYALLMTFISQHFQNIFMVWGVGDLPIGSFCIPVAEAVMVTCD